MYHAIHKSQQLRVHRRAEASGLNREEGGRLILKIGMTKESLLKQHKIDRTHTVFSNNQLSGKRVP
jgi:hypothetical protein